MCSEKSWLSIVITKKQNKQHESTLTNNPILLLGFLEVQCNTAVLLPQCPASLMHKNPHRCKIIHGMHPVGCKD